MIREDMRYLGTVLFMNSEFWLPSILKTNLLSFYKMQNIAFQTTPISVEKKKKECLSRFNFLPVSADFLQPNEKIWNTSKGKEVTQFLHYSINQSDFVMWQYDHQICKYEITILSPSQIPFILHFPQESKRTVY